MNLKLTTFFIAIAAAFSGCASVNPHRQPTSAAEIRNMRSSIPTERSDVVKSPFTGKKVDVQGIRPGSIVTDPHVGGEFYYSNESYAAYTDRIHREQVAAAKARWANMSKAEREAIAAQNRAIVEFGAWFVKALFSDGGGGSDTGGGMSQQDVYSGMRVENNNAASMGRPIPHPYVH